MNHYNLLLTIISSDKQQTMKEIQPYSFKTFKFDCTKTKYKLPLYVYISTRIESNNKIIILKTWNNQQIIHTQIRRFKRKNTCSIRYRFMKLLMDSGYTRNRLRFGGLYAENEGVNHLERPISSPPSKP